MGKREGVAVCAAWMLASTGLVAPARAQEASAAAADPGAAIEDIVVTAQRREETLQRSSLSLQVLSPEAIARGQLSQASDLNQLVPGIQIGGGGNAAQIYIRGVGDFAVSALSNPAVAVNVDGVYIARPQAVNSEFYDLARVEVLRGPQGTLYGRNASGGAINLITNAPKLGAVEGYLGGAFGNYDLRQAEGALNLPLGQTVAVRAAFNIVDRDGYLSDGTDDDEKQAGRVRLLFEPSSAVSLMLNADYAHEGGNGPGYVLLPRVPGTGKWTGGSDPRNNLVLNTTPPLGFIVPPIGTDTYRDNDFWNVSAELNADLGFATLTVLPAYRYARLSERNYTAGLRNTIPRGTSKATSIETRLANSSDRARWVVGGYYFREKQDSRQEIFEGILQDNIGFYRPITNSYAAFGELSYSLTDALRVIGGLRYTHERKSGGGEIYTNSPTAAPPGATLPALLVAFGGRDSFNSTTWKAGLEYDVAPQSMLFFTASTGFKAGGFNQTVAPLDTYDPEKLRALTLGSRNRFLDNRLQLNFELYHWRYRDAQVATVVFDPLGNVNLLVQNAGSARIQGANVDMAARLGRDTTLKFFAEYNDAKYRRFRYDTAFSIFGAPIFNPGSTGCDVSAPFPGSTFGTLLATIDCSGRRLPRSPKWSVSAGLDQGFDVGRGRITAHGDLQYASSRWLATDYVAPEHADDYTQLNADLTYTAPGDAWSLTAFARNITNAAAYTGAGEQAFVPPLTYASIAPPRTYGVRARINFR